MRHRLGLATRTQISVCKSPFPTASTSLSLFHAETCSITSCVFSLFSFLKGRQLLNCGAEAAGRAQCAAPDKRIGYWNLLVVFANLKRVIQCACFKSLGSRKGTPKCNLRILAVAPHLPRKWRFVSSSSSLQRGHNGSLTLRIIVRCRLRVLCPVRRYTSVLRSRWHCCKANHVSPMTWDTSSLACMFF